MTSEKPIALMDLDGTLADYDGALMRGMQELRSPTDPDLAPLLLDRDHEPAWLEARRKLITRDPDWWAELQPLPLGLKILDELKAIGFTVHILTQGPSTNPRAWEGKMRWCNQHLPGLPVTITRDNSLVYGRVLVDDWPQYVNPWLSHRPRGLAVVPAQPWNVSLTGPQIVRVDDTERTLAELRRRLKEAFDASPG